MLGLCVTQESHGWTHHSWQSKPPKSPLLLGKNVLVALVDVGAISFLYDWDCRGDMVSFMDGLVLTWDKSHTLLDCVVTPMGILKLVVMVTTLYHHRIEEMKMAVLYQNPVHRFPHCDES